jgi:hypothetical protein
MTFLSNNNPPLLGPEPGAPYPMWSSTMEAYTSMVEDFMDMLMVLLVLL